MSFKSFLFASLASLALAGAVASPAAADGPALTDVSTESASPPAGSELVESGTWQMGTWLPGENEGIITNSYTGVKQYLYANVGDAYDGQYIGVSTWIDGNKIWDCNRTLVSGGEIHITINHLDGSPVTTRFGICHDGFEQAPIRYGVWNKAN